MNTKLAMLSFAVACALGGNASAMTKAEYDAQKTRISADYKAGRDKCSSLTANARDICQAEARGAEKVAKAEAESQYKPSAKNTRDVAMARAGMM